MTSPFVLLCICSVLFLSNVSSLETVNGKIKLTMGTASGCGNALNFIRNHLIPSYEMYHEYLEVDFVPWGRTVQNPDGSQLCQFGVNDCWANRLHRCVLNYLGDNTMAKVKYIDCEFTSPFPSFNQRSFVCALSVGWNREEAEFCVNNPQLDTLDHDAQTAAAEPMRIINWVPFVVFNDNIDVDSHWDAHQKLGAMLCEAFINDPNIPIRGCMHDSGVN